MVEENATRVTSPPIQDPAPPAFWKSRVSEVSEVLAAVDLGKRFVLTASPDGYIVEGVAYGARVERRAAANYSSAVGAGRPELFRGRPSGSPPVVLLIGGLHGHEVEGIVGLLNLVQVAETGQDYRGVDWPRLCTALDECRLLVVPVANPDGRCRCKRDDFLGVPVEEMSRIGQGTRRDGTLYGWPGAKAAHPMKDDVGLLGAYFNGSGINLMHDDFFAPMAAETRALLDLARAEAPDLILNLHSHGSGPVLLPTAYVPRYHRVQEYELAARVEERFLQSGLPTGGLPIPSSDGEKYPPPAFNLTSALHHVCGALSLLFESPHGLAEPQYPKMTHQQILDLHLILFEELLTWITSSAGRNFIMAGG